MTLSQDQRATLLNKLKVKRTKNMNQLQTTNTAEVIIPLKDLVLAYVEAKDRLKTLDEEYDKQAEPLKQAKDELQSRIIQVFKERGEFTTRIDGATATLSVKKTAQVVDPNKVIATLKAKGLTEYISESLNELFDEPKKMMAAGKSALIDGIVIKETEYISVRTNDKADARKISTDDYKKLS